MPMFIQRFSLVGVVVVVVLLAHRFVPPSMGIFGRIFVITGITAAVLWGTSAVIKFVNARQASRRG
jgi:hypothetical protein